LQEGGRQRRRQGQQPQQPQPQEDPEQNQQPQAEQQAMADDAPAANNPAAAAAANVVPFALTPAEVDNDPIDYRTNDGKKLYKAATAPLATKFDGTADRYFLFLNDIMQHAEEHNWGPILQIPNDNNVERSLLDKLGELSEANIRAHAMTYIANNNSRDAQRSTQMYYFLYHSLEDGIRNRVTAEKSRYIVTINDRKYFSGPLFLKAISALVNIDTTSTVADVHAQLHNLDNFMRTGIENCNIERFNAHVRALRNQLENRSETISDMQLNLHLFRGYAACTDNEFVNFITNIRNQVLYQGFIHTPDEIMTLALRYFTDRTRRGQWNQPSAEHEQIMALTAQLRSFQQQRNHRDNKKGKSKGKGGKGDNNKKGKKRQEPRWKSTPPEPGESTTKTINGKTFHWCQKHGKWGGHSTDSCKGIGINKENQAKNQGNDKKVKFERKPPNNKLQLQKALTAIIEHSEDNDSDDE
jgi:hypothetical protein